MSLRKFLFLTTACLLVFDSRADNTQVALSKSGKCFEEMNDARQAARLPPFRPAATEKDRLPLNWSKGNIWEPVCDSYLKSETPNTGGDRSDGVYAILNFDVTEPLDCNSAVHSWKRGFRSFPEVPPKKTENAELYSNQDNLSFIALYNSQVDATIDCRIAFCFAKDIPAPERPEGPKGPGSSQGPEGPQDPEPSHPSRDFFLTLSGWGKYFHGRRSGGGAAKPVQQPVTPLPDTKAAESIPDSDDAADFTKLLPPGSGKGLGNIPRAMLVCKSSPNPLNNDNSPFTPEQWANIRKSTGDTSSATLAPLAPVVAISAVAVTLAIF